MKTWKRDGRTGGIAIALAAALVAGAQADEKKIETKSKERARATAVNFAGALGLDFPGLITLGGRIEQARGDCDPVGLAAAASELGVAEAVSGKTASVTSANLFTEAMELAKLRNLPTELKAVALMVNDDAAKKDLMDAAAKEEAAIAARKDKSPDAGEREKGIQARLFVYNHTNELIRVYVDGYFQGNVAPFDWGSVWVGQGAYETTYLKAESATGSWTNEVSQPVGDYHWHLWP